MHRAPDGEYNSHRVNGRLTTDVQANLCKTKTSECKMVDYRERRDIISTPLVILRRQT